MRILVVEDDKDLNRQLTTALSGAGYAVDCAFDGEEGHFLGDTEPYDVVILDIGLPKLDGISILEQWRRAERNMPVIISKTPNETRRRWRNAPLPPSEHEDLMTPFGFCSVLMLRGFDLGLSRRILRT